VPVMADIVTDRLGVAANADGTVIAQHGSNSSYVTTANPAQPGEVLVIYLTGMGPTNPPVSSGNLAPSSAPLALVTNAPTVSLKRSSCNGPICRPHTRFCGPVRGASPASFAGSPHSSEHAAKGHGESP
jgi:hypothetical protein